MTPRIRFSLFGAPILVGALLGLGGVVLEARAQTQEPATEPEVFVACYGSLTGVVYRTEENGLPSNCLHRSHVRFSWTDGAGSIKSGDAAAGDLSGTYPDPAVAKLQGTAISSAPPTSGQVLTFNGAEWAPATPSSTLESANGQYGISITDTGLELIGPGGRVTISATGIDLVTVTGTFLKLQPSGPSLTGPIVRLNCGSSGVQQGVARVGDLVQGGGGVGSFAGSITTGSGTVVTCSP